MHQPRDLRRRLQQGPAVTRDWESSQDGGRLRVGDTRRAAQFWRRQPGGRVVCDLCYRRCDLADGETGWCGYRVNQAGAMQIPAHGVLAAAVRQMRGYQADPFLTYKPGALSLFLGGTSCTAGCTFCMSTRITWRPEQVDWLGDHERGVGYSGGWYAARAMLHPLGALEAARVWECSQIEFGINEPTLTVEYTRDVAILAKHAGLDVVIDTNGFSLRPVIRWLAPYVDAVDVGVKGSGDPEFYAHWMRADGAVPSVLRALSGGRAAGRRASDRGRPDRAAAAPN